MYCKDNNIQKRWTFDFINNISDFHYSDGNMRLWTLKQILYHTSLSIFALSTWTTGIGGRLKQRKENFKIVHKINRWNMTFEMFVQLSSNLVEMLTTIITFCITLNTWIILDKLILKSTYSVWIQSEARWPAPPHLVHSTLFVIFFCSGHSQWRCSTDPQLRHLKKKRRPTSYSTNT